MLEKDINPPSKMKLIKMSAPSPLISHKAEYSTPHKSPAGNYRREMFSLIGQGNDLDNASLAGI